MSDFLYNVSTLCLLVLFFSALLVLYRLAIGPRAGDRAVAFDVLATILIGVICILTIMWNSSLFFDAVWILTLVGFLGTAAMARYLERGRVF